MSPYIRYFYEYGFNAAIQQQVDPSFTGEFNKIGPLAALPTPLYFKGDPTRLIEKEWWLPILSRVVSDLLKIKVTSGRMAPMRDLSSLEP